MMELPIQDGKLAKKKRNSVGTQTELGYARSKKKCDPHLSQLLAYVGNKWKR